MVAASADRLLDWSAAVAVEVEARAGTGGRIAMSRMEDAPPLAWSLVPGRNRVRTGVTASWARSNTRTNCVHAMATCVCEPALNQHDTERAQAEQCLSQCKSYSC